MRDEWRLLREMSKSTSSQGLTRIGIRDEPAQDQIRELTMANEAVKLSRQATGRQESLDRDFIKAEEPIVANVTP